MSIRRQDRFFDVADISQRIKVQKPYFAFHQLWQDEDQLVGKFAAEQPLVYETGVITAGELGRHMAILGSCAAVALHNGPEAYYLATEAHFSRKNHKRSSCENIFHASAKVIDMDKRTLRVQVKTWSKDPVAELMCDYAILSPALFQRSFSHYANDRMVIPERSPYQHPIALYNQSYHSDKLNAYAGPLTPQQCAGHFYQYPCWPVAIISQTAFQVTGELIIEKYGKEMRFCVHDTKLSAKKLIGADSVLKFSVEIVSSPEEAALIESVVDVYHNDEIVAQLKNSLELTSDV
jgi:hypothetical protein